MLHDVRAADNGRQSFGETRVSVVSRYFDSLVAPHFKEDESGRALFYPMGALSCGRVMPDATVSDRLRRTVRTSYAIMFLVWIPVIAIVSGTFHRMSWRGLMVIVGLGIVSGIAFSGWLRLLVRHHPKTDVRLTFGESARTQAKTMGRSSLLISLLCSVLFAAVSIMIALTELGTASRAMALVSIVFFGACAISNWLALRSLDRDGDAKAAGSR